MTTTEVDRATWREVLQSICRDVLGISDIDHDDDLTLHGADSIGIMRIVGRARQAGVPVDAQAAFLQPTIAAMAESSDPDPDPPGPLDGVDAERVRATPGQRLLLDAIVHPERHTVPFVVSMPPEVTPGLAARAIRLLVDRHDAFRLRLTADRTAWRHSAGSAAAGHLFDVVDVPPGADLWAMIRRESVEIALDTAPLCRVRLFRRSAEEQFLLFLAHHLVIDAAGVEILLDDLEAVVEFLTGARARLPNVTGSFRRWCSWLADFHRSLDHTATAASWADFLGGSARVPVPHDFVHGPNQMQDTAVAGKALSASDTRQLRAAVGRDPRLTVEGSLVAALAAGYHKTFGEPTFSTTLTRSGRRPTGSSPDPSGIVGWLTYHFPVRVGVEPDRDVTEWTGQVCRSLTQVPHGGLSFSLLEYFSDEPTVRETVRRLGTPECMFIFHGDRDAQGRSRGWCRTVDIPGGWPRSPAGRRTVFFQMSAEIIGGELRFANRYSTNHHSARSISDWLAAAVAHLQALAAGRPA
jgi:aryl carrier-like protein